MEKRDLVIHYDEERGEIIFHSVSSAETSDLREKSFDGMRPEVSYFKGLAPDEAEKAIGRLVFSFIDLNSISKIGIRDYESEAEGAHAEYVNELEQQVKAGDLDGMFYLAQEMHRVAMKNYSLNDLNRAEELLNRAAREGHQNAREWLQSIWPTLKHAAESRIARGDAA